MPAPTDRIKVVVDTDIGTDPDDGLALAYLALHPRCELLGVTIVSGDVQQRAAVAEILLSVCTAAIPPIHCGRREPLLEGLGQPLVQQYEAAAAAARDSGTRQQRQPPRLDRPENTAVAFLRDTIRAHPGEVVLLTLGPLSNVALLFALDPALPALCRDVVSMAGRYLAPGALKEWNVLVDRTAAGMVLGTPRPRHRFCGLDVTTEVTWSAAEVERFVAGPPPRPGGDDTEENPADRRLRRRPELRALLGALGLPYARHKGRQRFHDPLAAAAVFAPDLCEWRTGRVSVDPRNGATSFAEGVGSDLVAARVDADRFFRHWLDVVLGESEPEPTLTQ